MPQSDLAIRPDHEPLFQIFVTERHPVHGRFDKPVGPAMCRRYLEPMIEAIGKVILSGAMRDWEAPWSDPRLVQVTAPMSDTPFTREDRAIIGDHRLSLPH